MLDYDMAILNFLATFSGVGFAFFLTLWYDHSKKVNDEKESRQRMLTTIRTELRTNVEILGELDKNKVYGAGQMLLWRDGYQSAVNGGGISLLDPRIQTQLGMLYLQFRQLDVYGGKLLALLGLPFTTELEIVLKGTQVLMEQSMKSALLLIPKGLEVIDAELKQLSATSKWKFWGARQTSTMSPSQGGLMDKLHYRYEWLITAVVIESIILDWLIFQQFSEFTRLPVISSISGVFITVEGILIGLSPQIKVNWSRDFVAAGIGVPALSQFSLQPKGCGLCLWRTFFNRIFLCNFYPCAASVGVFGNDYSPGVAAGLVVALRGRNTTCILRRIHSCCFWLHILGCLSNLSSSSAIFHACRDSQY